MEQDLSKQQEGMERMGLLVGSFYAGLVREGMPNEVAERMCSIFLDRALAAGVAQAQQKQQPIDLQAELLRLMRGGGRA